MRRGQSLTLLPRQGDFHLSSDGLGNVALESQNVPHFPFIFLRPKVLVGRAPNQLGMDSNLAARSDYRPFHNCIYPKSFSNFWQWKLRVLKSHDRCPGNDAQVADSREAADQSLRHSIR